MCTTNRIVPIIGIVCICALTLIGGSALAQGPADEVGGTWHKNSDPRNVLKLELRQFGDRVIGHFLNNKKKWMVRGTLSPNGTLALNRWIPISELTETTDKGREFARQKYGIVNQPSYLRGTVTFKYNPSSLTLTGFYTVIAIDVENNVPSGRILKVPLTMGQPLPSKLPVLVDRNTRFHRLFLIGPGYNPKEEESFVVEAKKFASLLDSRQHSKKGSTSKMIIPADGKSVGAIKKEISALKFRAKPGDQVLVYVSSHGWGGAYSRDLNPMYSPIYRKMQLEHFRRHAMTSEIEQFDRAGKMTGKPTIQVHKDLLEKYKKKFRDVFFKKADEYKIKRIKGEEFYRESIWITDPKDRYKTNNNEWIFDKEVATLLKPIISAGVPLTLFMDSCFGGGFADNVPASERVQVIGLKITCPNPKNGRRFTLTARTSKLIREASLYSADLALVSAQDVKKMLRKRWPKAVGTPADDKRDIDGTHEKQ